MKAGPLAGVMGMACTHRMTRNTGDLQWCPEPPGNGHDKGSAPLQESEGLIVLLKPGNAGGGKGPWFKADTGSNEVCEIGATLGNSGYRQELRTAYHAEAKEGLEPGSRNLPAGDGRSRWLRQLS